METELSNSFESLISSELILSPEAEDTFNEEAQQWTSRIARKAIYGFHEEELQDHYVPDKQYKVLLLIESYSNPLVYFNCSCNLFFIVKYL